MHLMHEEVGDAAMRSTHRQRATRVLKVQSGTLIAACTAGPTPTLPRIRDRGPRRYLSGNGDHREG